MRRLNSNRGRDARSAASTTSESAASALPGNLTKVVEDASTSSLGMDRAAHVTGGVQQILDVVNVI